jgi:hypothetical protein
MILIFGSGDGGGLWIHPNGTIERLPPFGPAEYGLFKSVGKLAAASDGINDPITRDQVITASTAIARQVGAMLIAQYGEAASGDSSIIFLDRDNGFICGSTGQPPIPIPATMSGSLACR